MFDTLPKTYDEAKTWDWPKFEPFFADLEARDLTPETVDQWLRDMTARTTDGGCLATGPADPPRKSGRALLR